MKLSCLPVSLNGALASGDWTLPAWFEFARELGLDGADINMAHLVDRSMPALLRLRRQAGMAGVRIPMLVADYDFTHPDATARKRQQTRLRADIATAAEVAPFLRVTAGQAHPGIAHEDGIGWAVDGLTSQLDFARQAKVTLLYENHTISDGWRYRDFSQPAPVFSEIVNRTAGSGLCILFNTANAYVAGDGGIAVMDAIMERIAVVHAADIKRAGEDEPVVLGTGEVPLYGLMQRLYRQGFDGWISIREASLSGRVGFEQAVPHMRHLWATAAE